MRSHLSTDGGKAWHDRVHDNAMSFDEVHKSNKAVNIGDAQKALTAAHTAARSALSLP